ncbi:hypothetical protein EX30DRAFT_339383 [Ascodesmis nigricans]|uniref:CDP-diacylglycerol--glycerol-3-phosphate 3-phosphatidyltransferase n=1 Tax=Ascodesmis nigricans TaxID=341454 RepID=A0A4S2N1Z0_9PEZI|nr:hypothetical protein EX30DRAFT_339383 [Ascodesmis nigricans]
MIAATPALRPLVCRAPITFYSKRITLQCSKRFIATSTAAPPSTTAAASKASALGLLTAELDKIAPRFEVDANSIRIIRTPSDFYSTLKDRILKAERRIFLSTLYIGKSEHELIEVLRESLRIHPHLKVSILSDALRGTRETPNPSCASLLAPLIAEFGPERVEIRMYHTPNLKGLKKKVVPKRINEGWGLQHMKLYGFDDEIIMSGANLSTDYFTNRQDRYHLFFSRQLTNHYERIHQTICSLSYKVIPDDGAAGYVLEWPQSNPAPIPTEEPDTFRSVATSLLNPLIAPWTDTSRKTEKSKTFVYPLAQFTPLLRPKDTSTEHPALSVVLQQLSRDEAQTSQWIFTAGYFNIHPELKQLLLESKSAKGTVITAAPEANGFYGSKGVSGMLPPAYTLLARRFLGDVVKAGKIDHIELREWRKGTIGKDPDAWTYHAKGVWVTLPHDPNPAVTLIGSSNYTKRSYSLDLEMNALVVTEDEGLKERLKNETEWLQEHSRKVTMEDFERTERRVSLKVRVALWLVGALGGQL